jgi:hypothetical protein
MDPSLPEAAAMGGQPAVDPPLVLPLVLQVFPLLGSSDTEEFHGGPPSCPNPVGINVELSSRLAILLRFGGHGLHYDPHPQYVCSSPASRMGNVPYNYGGFFRTAPPPQLWLLPSWPRRPSCASWGAHICPSVSVGAWGVSCSSLGFTFICMGGIPMRLHRLSRAWRLRARCFTLLCHRRITVPHLDLTLPCHFPALVEAYLLLSCTIPGLG